MPKDEKQEFRKIITYSMEKMTKEKLHFFACLMKNILDAEGGAYDASHKIHR